MTREEVILRGLKEGFDQDLWDRFAEAALTGFLAAYAVDGLACPTPLVAAKCAYNYATAMLVERSNQLWGMEDEPPKPNA